MRQSRVPILAFLMLTLAFVSSAPTVLAQQTTIAVPQEAFTAPLDQQTPVGPNVTVGRFDNGLRYFIRENQEPENRAELRFVVSVGSIVEDGRPAWARSFCRAHGLQRRREFREK